MGRKTIVPNVGDTFNLLTVLDNTPVIVKGHTHILFKCECGHTALRNFSQIKIGKVKGCTNCRARARGVGKDIKIGDKYKHWTVIDGPKISSHRNKQWKVQCDCTYKTERWITGTQLVNPSNCFSCIKCAAIPRTLIFTKNNGRVGDLIQSKFSKIQRGAKARNLAFTLTKKYLWELFENQKQLCAITGEYIDSIKNASLDRINSNIPYIEGNVQWVTIQANSSKHIMSMKELIEFCHKVINYANQQPSQS
jgi:hypothetical protein